MNNALLFFGAGASLGATACGDALPDQRGLLKRFLSVGGELQPELKVARSIVVEYLRAMYSGPLHEESLPLEEVIGPLEWLDSRQSSCHIGGSSMRNSRTLVAFDTLLASTLNRPILNSRRVPVYSDDLTPQLKRRYDDFYSMSMASPNAYAVLAQKLAELAWPVSLISFNYDLLMDRVLLHHQSGVRVDYHVPHPALEPYFEDGRRTTVSLIKPHGSLNWLWCAGCHRLTVTATKMVFSGSRCRRCATAEPHVAWPEGSNRVLLLRPSFLKSRGLAATLWDQLLVVGRDRMAQAPVWVFIGYSFPLADYWIRGWFREAMAAGGNQYPKRVIVVDPGTSSVDRFRSFFGGETVEHHQEGFWQFAHNFSSNMVSP